MAVNRNEVIKDGETILSTRGTTVAPENLASGETAIDHEGNSIVGVMPTLDVDDLYRVPDDAGIPDDTDYIPYNDVSDEEEPTKKTLFSTIIDKLKNTFLVKSWGHVTLRDDGEALDIKDTQIDASKTNNDISSTHYPTTNSIVDKNNRILARFENVIMADGRIGVKMYARNYNTSGTAIAGNGIEAYVDKSGNCSYSVTDPNKFREAIKTIDQYGTTIPNNSNINDYKTAGTYYIGSNTRAETMTNLPIARAGKLIVMCNTASQYITQFFIPYDAKQGFPYYRSYNGDGSVWRQWVSIADSTHLLTSEVRDLAGHSIVYTDDLNNFTNSGTYQYSYNSNGMPANAPNFGDNRSFKLVVDRYGADSRSEIMQTVTMINKTNQGLWWRVREWASSTWGSWYHVANTSDISPSTVGNGYAVATVSGSAITATITGFQLRAGVIVAIKIANEMSSACTLNINSTGAKNIKFWDNEDPSYGKPIGYGQVHTLIYDGTYFRVISMDRTPFIGAQSYVANTSGNIVMDWGYGSDRAELKHKIESGKLVYNYYKNSAWNGDIYLADYRDLGASIGRAGKNVLPAWGVSYNQTNSINGLIFSFNYETGEITGNGTATADSWFVMYSGKNRTAQEYLLKGTYILSGCPSGGSESTYFLYGEVDGLSVKDYGSSATMNLSSDRKMNGDFSIFVKSGQTLNNLVFKPMLRPAWTTSDFEPCEDIHKGNCYVGTCTTAGATKDKVAYVDGYFVLRKGVRVAIKYSNTNTYSNTTSSPITLNVNNTGAKYIWGWATHSGAGNTGTATCFYGDAGRYVYYLYDGTYWVWDGESGDLNSTNFLRNDANSTLTVSGAPEIVLKSTTIDTKQTNNGLSNTWYPCLRFTDKNNEVFNRWESVVETNGNVTTFLYARNYNTSTSSYFLGGLRIFANKAGDIWYGFSNPHYANTALGCGYGTCDTAEATTAKVVSLARYVIALNGYVTVKFTYGVPANATMNINGQGAKAIYYHGSAIKAGVIRAGDLATFIYATGYYHLIGVDRTNYKSINYNYLNSTGRPNYLTFYDSNVLCTQFNYVVEGDVVTVSMNLKWTATTNYSSDAKICSGFIAPSQAVFAESLNKSFYMINSTGDLYIRAVGSISANTVLWGLHFTYIRS